MQLYDSININLVAYIYIYLIITIRVDQKKCLTGYSTSYEIEKGMRDLMIECFILPSEGTLIAHFSSHLSSCLLVHSNVSITHILFM